MKLRIAGLIFIALAACKGHSGKTGNADGSIEPPVLGDDTDHNGIRDDLQVYIDSLKSDAETDQALKLYARAFQRLLEATGKETAVAAGKSLVDAVQCLYHVNFDQATQLSNALESHILNTEERIRTYFKVTRTLGGVNFEHRTPEDKANSCAKVP